MPEKKIPVAIQLYSLRDVTPKDVPGTLHKVAAMGYEGVEFAGFYNLDGTALRKLLADCGLHCAGAHCGLDALEGAAFEQTVAMNRLLGNDRLIVPSADLKDLSRTIDRLNAAHVRAKARGMRVGFHNHLHEFDLENGATKFDRIFSETPGDLLVQLDIGWAACAGQDVPAILRKHGKRIETVHVKEFSPDNLRANVGEGSVNWRAIFDILEKETSVQWYIVEQEQYAIGPMESAKSCIDFIRKLGR
ncbi:MAG: sugar phosphate isomerase/epimerase [Kiritimatiellae bacterium]|nr:sugar phosphate isomerase/epimerase [Kiritimatiellia bacterium]